MPASRRLGRLLVVASVGFGLVAHAQTPQETKREDILDELGLKKKAPAPPSAATAAPAGEPTTAEPKPEGPGGKAKSGGRTAGPAGPSFTRAIYPLVLATCKACHTAGGAAGATPLVLTGDPEADHRLLARFADVQAPEASKLLQKASGAVLHGGGAPWPAASAPYERVLAWIRAGARLNHTTHEEAAAGPEARGRRDTAKASATRRGRPRPRRSRLRCRRFPTPRRPFPRRPRLRPRRPS